MPEVPARSQCPFHRPNEPVCPVTHPLPLSPLLRGSAGPCPSLQPHGQPLPGLAFVLSSALCPRLLVRSAARVANRDQLCCWQLKDKPARPSWDWRWGPEEMPPPPVQASEPCWHFPLWLSTCDMNQLLPLAEVTRKLKLGSTGGPGQPMMSQSTWTPLDVLWILCELSESPGFLNTVSSGSQEPLGAL